MKISVIICAHNPNLKFLDKVLNSLKLQTLGKSEWELLIIDNGSNMFLTDKLNLSWHPESRIIREDELGLIYARIRGTREALYEILVSVDDDTPLEEHYLEHVLAIYGKYPELGIVGGKTIPLFEKQEPDWLPEFYTCLAIRDLGNEEIIQKLEPQQALETYPSAAPLLIAPLKHCMEDYIRYFESNDDRKKLGRKGDSLASGEDNDINLFIYKNGYALGYFPQLIFYHIIPEKRMTPAYLSRLNFSMNQSWISVLNLNKILPWSPISKWTVPLRNLKAYVKCKAWMGPANFIRWKGLCGMFKGLSNLNN